MSDETPDLFDDVPAAVSESLYQKIDSRNDFVALAYEVDDGRAALQNFRYVSSGRPCRSTKAFELSRASLFSRSHESARRSMVALGRPATIGTTGAAALNPDRLFISNSIAQSRNPIRKTP